MNHRTLPARSSIKIVRALELILELDGRSRKEITGLAGCSPNLLRMWMIGRCSPSVQTLEALLEVMDYELRILPKGAKNVLPHHNNLHKK